MNYKKAWVTLKEESGYRWCQPHPNSMELLRLNDLMVNMEKRMVSKPAPNSASLPA